MFFLKHVFTAMQTGCPRYNASAFHSLKKKTYLTQWMMKWQFTFYSVHCEKAQKGFKILSHRTKSSALNICTQRRFSNWRSCFMIHFTLKLQNECSHDSLQSNKKNKTLETQKQLSSNKSGKQKGSCGHRKT